MKTVHFSETIVDSDLKVGTCKYIRLIELMKIFEH